MNAMQGWVNFQATSDEYTAIHRAIDVYIYYIERIAVSPAERSLVIAALRSFQMRPRRHVAGMVTFRVTVNEALAFGSAIPVYCRLVAVALPYSAQELHTKRLVIDFQSRYLNAVRPTS